MASESAGYAPALLATRMYSVVVATFCAAAMLLITICSAVAAEKAPKQVRFDHIKTGFNLTGAHLRARCESCHISGVFRGTPTQCAVCHAAGNRFSAKAKPQTHIPTNAACDTCHKTTAWLPAQFWHEGVAAGTCRTCHNGTMAGGQTSSHIRTTASCDACHSTISWRANGFNHQGVARGTCATCHNGSTAKGKPATHIATTAACDSCHRTTAWIPATFSHTGVAPGTCATCHNGSSAKGKTANHVMTTASCDACHKTTAWIPATFSHTGVAPGTCKTCHNGTTAKGMSANHIPVTTTFAGSVSCDLCHRSTTTFTSATMSHTGVITGSCATCHNGTFARGKPNGHPSTTKSCDSSGCHNTRTFSK